MIYERISGRFGNVFFQGCMGKKIQCKPLNQPWTSNKRKIPVRDLLRQKFGQIASAYKGLSRDEMYKAMKEQL